MPEEKILVVDDTGFNRIILERMLAAAGYEVLQAASGKEGLRTLNTENVTLVISDLLMPEMDGLEFFRQAKSRALGEERERRPCPPFILCTAVTGKDFLQEAVHEGFADVLVKPVDRERLLSTVARCLSDSQSPFVETPIAGPKASLHSLAVKVNGTPEDVLDALVEALETLSIPERVNSVEALKAWLIGLLKS